MVNECQDFFIIFKIRVFFHLKFERKKLQKPSAILIIGFLTLLSCNKQCFCPLYILTTQCVYMGKLTRCSVPLMNKDIATTIKATIKRVTKRKRLLTDRFSLNFIGFYIVIYCYSLHPQTLQ